MIFLCYWFSIN